MRLGMGEQFENSRGLYNLILTRTEIFLGNNILIRVDWHAFLRREGS
jgi:hypothetical protein